MQNSISNKIQGRNSRRDLGINKQIDIMLQSRLFNNSIKLNLENIQRSTSEQFITPTNNKYSSKYTQNLSNISKEGLSFGLTDREMNSCQNEIQAMQSNCKNLLGTTLSVRTSLSNYLYSPKQIDLTNKECESPNIKRKYFKFKDKENQTNQEIQQKVEQMKVNYIKSSVTLNQQLNDNTRLLQQIDELKKQQQNLSSNYYSLKKDQSSRRNKKVALNLKVNNTSKQLISLKQQSLIDLIANQQLIIQDLQKKLQNEKTEKEFLKLCCQSPRSDKNQLDIKQMDIRKSQNKFNFNN